MLTLTATAMRLGTTALVRAYLGPTLVWSAGGTTTPDPTENLILPAYIPADPLWPSVAIYTDFGRGFADQSERGHAVAFVSDLAPGISDAGVTLDGSTQGLRYEADAPSFGIGARDACIELFGLRLTANVACTVAGQRSVSAGGRAWRLRWMAPGWQITLSADGTAETSISVNDSVDPTAAPMHLAIERAGGTLRMWRDGALLYSGVSTSEIWAAPAGLHVGHSLTSGTPGASDFAPMILRALRMTIGAVRRGSDAAYTPAIPALDRPRKLFGARRLGWGAWTWFNDPRVLGHAGKITFGAATVQAELFEFDPSTTRLRHARMGNVGLDDHNNPAIIRRADGRMVTMATGHNWPSVYVGVSPGVDDAITGTTFADVGSQIGLTEYSYSNLAQLEGEAGAPIYQIGRENAPFMLYMTKSLDGGASWQPYQRLFSGSGRPYVKMVKTSTTRLDILVTDGHPDSVANNSVYHGYFEGGAWYRSDGTPVGSMPFLPSALTKIHDGTGARCWNAEIRKIGNQLAVLYMTYPTTADHRYWRGLWTGSAWQTEQICAAGGPLYGGQPYYSGGLTFAHDSLSVVYASRQDGGGIHQIHRCTRMAGGAWQMEQMTQGERPSFRPYVVTGPDTLLWVNGRYQTYTNYRSSICALPLPLVVSP